jgi:hypothetical protein
LIEGPRSATSCFLRLFSTETVIGGWISARHLKSLQTAWSRVISVVARVPASCRIGEYCRPRTIHRATASLGLSLNALRGCVFVFGERRMRGMRYGSTFSKASRKALRTSTVGSVAERSSHSGRSRNAYCIGVGALIRSFNVHCMGAETPSPSRTFQPHFESSCWTCESVSAWPCP